MYALLKLDKIIYRNLNLNLINPLNHDCNYVTPLRKFKIYSKELEVSERYHCTIEIYISTISPKT